MNLNIVTIDRTLPDAVCTTVHWTASKVDGDYTASSYGSLGLPDKDPNDPTFVPYEDITEAQAIEWVKSAMGEESLANLEAGLDAQKHPVSASGVPWLESQNSESLEG